MSYSTSQPQKPITALNAFMSCLYTFVQSNCLKTAFIIIIIQHFSNLTLIIVIFPSFKKFTHKLIVFYYYLLIKLSLSKHKK